MPDDDLMTEIRERFEPARMTTPLDTVVARGRAVRRRRRVPVAAGAVVAAGAAAAIAATVLAPAAGGTGKSLAAWTVAVRPDGVVTVTITDAQDLSGLQARLRADGVPAFVNPPGAACPSSPKSPSRLAVGHRVFRWGNAGSGPAFFQIVPAAIPPGQAVGIYVGLYTAAGRPTKDGPAAAKITWDNAMLTASGQCLP